MAVFEDSVLSSGYQLNYQIGRPTTSEPFMGHKNVYLLYWMLPLVLRCGYISPCPIGSIDWSAWFTYFPSQATLPSTAQDSASGAVAQQSHHHHHHHANNSILAKEPCSTVTQNDLIIAYIMSQILNIGICRLFFHLLHSPKLIPEKIERNPQQLALLQCESGNAVGTSLAVQVFIHLVGMI